MVFDEGPTWPDGTERWYGIAHGLCIKEPSWLPFKVFLSISFQQYLAPVTPVMTFVLFSSFSGALAPLSPVCHSQSPLQSLTMALLGPGDKSYTFWESEMGFGGTVF